MKGHSEQPLIKHLFELRTTALRCIISIILITIILLPFSNQIYSFIATPLIAKLPEGSSMIATEVASPFFAPFKLTLFCGIFFSIPYILYQTWSFIAPGLYINERKLILPLLVSSSLLFYLGIFFAYYVVFPILFAFLTTTAPSNITVMTDINHYLDFIIKLFFAFLCSALPPRLPFCFMFLCFHVFINLQKRHYSIGKWSLQRSVGDPWETPWEIYRSETPPLL